MRTISTYAEIPEGSLLAFAIFALIAIAVAYVAKSEIRISRREPKPRSHTVNVAETLILIFVFIAFVSAIVKSVNV